MSAVTALNTLKQAVASSIQRFKYMVKNFGVENIPELSKEFYKALESFKETDDVNIRVIGSSLQLYVLHDDDSDIEESSTYFCFKREDIPSLYKDMYRLKSEYDKLLQREERDKIVGMIQEYEERIKILI